MSMKSMIPILMIIMFDENVYDNPILPILNGIKEINDPILMKINLYLYLMMTMRSTKSMNPTIIGVMLTIRYH